MYIEAEPIINTLNLKKDVTITKFQVFKNIVQRTSEVGTNGIKKMKRNCLYGANSFSI